MFHRALRTAQATVKGADVLTSPDHAVVGATDVDATVAFLTALGFAVTAEDDLDTAAARGLYGLERPLRQVWLGMPGAPAGGVRVVACDETSGPPQAFARGATALDLYTRDMDASLRTAAAAGAHCGPVGRYAAGPAAIAEARAIGPDGLPVVFIDITQRRPSVLDRAPDRLHSEVHSIVWAVEDPEAAAAPWSAAGLDVLADLTLRDPSIDIFLELPEPGTALRLVLLAGPDQAPARLELLAYERTRPARPSWPLRGGLHAAALVVDDLDAALAALPAVRAADPVAVPGGRAATAVAPGGLRVELRERPACPRMPDFRP